ncbi:hypothetical protein AZE42_13121 [Rhizopogon vesiculosus]|uniref:Uncharacterized protein n=1 Tax=Rhizopogon vesiculosus TaxID=180088 RepID=A0A1J8R3P8_9AGAM|nr:hypothetical protein AZE42_13121 [Rhizopogon vesiculosus]
MDGSYEVCYRDPQDIIHNMLANPDFDGEIDYMPYQDFNVDGHQEWKDFMSGDWAYKQANIIAKDPMMHGSVFVPVILGSDKMTVSVATGQTDYYPLYASIGNVRNNVQQAHHNAVAVVGFLAIPKTDQQHISDPAFWKFRWQLFHSSLSKILETLKPAMSRPEVARCADKHYRHVIYGLGPYIADYEEQVVLACIVKDWCAKCLAYPNCLDEGGSKRCRDHAELLIKELALSSLWDKYGIVGKLVPFTNDFPCTDIHELLAPDLLHQLIKGTFKDHLVAWVQQYLEKMHSKTEAAKIVTLIVGLLQWHHAQVYPIFHKDEASNNGQVYLPAIKGHVPQDIVCTFCAFLEFCYIAWHDYHTEESLMQLQDALSRFHKYCVIFQTVGVHLHLSLPCQHSMVHYFALTRCQGILEKVE